MSEQEAPYRGRSGSVQRDAGGWDAERVRRLRRHLGQTQQAFAGELGTRQQTVSEWETGASRPRGMSRRLLHMVAEEHAFYQAEAPGPEAGAALEGGGERR